MWLLIIAFAIIGWLLWRKVLWPWDELPSIPGPKPVPFFGVIFELMKYKSSEDFQAAFSKKYGPYYKLYLPFTQMLQVGDPEIVKASLYNHKAGYDVLMPLLKNGLVTTEEEKWKHDRKLLDQAFSFKYLRGLHSTIIKHTQKLIDEWNKYPVGTKLNATTDFTNFTFDIIGEVAVNTQFNAIESGDKITHPILLSFIEALTDLATLFKYPWTQLNFFAHARTRKNVKFIKEQVINGVNERRKQHQQSAERKNDILDILLTVNEKTGEPEFTDEDIVDHLNTFLFAGHDTTAVLLSMTYFALGQRPELKKKCLEDLEFLRSKKFIPSYDDLGNMNYIGMVLNESLRLYPPASSARTLTPENAAALGIKDISKLRCATHVHISSYLAHLNTKYWDNPMEYNPDRFTPENVAKRDPLAFIPFLAGPRKCIGNNFALMEAKTALAMLLPRFDFTTSSDDIGWGYQIVSKPLKGVKIVIEDKITV
jgi:cytochrome P450